MWPNPQKTVDLVTFTEEILNGRLHFLCKRWLSEPQKHLFTSLTSRNHCQLLESSIYVFNRHFVARHVLFTNRVFYLRIVILQNTDRYKKKKKLETRYRLKHAQVLYFCILFLYTLILMTTNNASNLYMSQESWNSLQKFLCMANNNTKRIQQIN